ncbi:MAG: hypothetical protein K0R76_551 [Alphaproteobacteria bacterium]|jgi:hypothetical protein|nr:hypothetical protein [Alphaproteobacteria bacterium]
MSIENKEWLKATNDFALLGIKFLYLSNGGAILAILGNLKAFNDTNILSCSLIMFICGLLFSLLSNFSGYLLYGTILINEQNKRDNGYAKNCSQGWMYIAIFFAVASFSCFGYGAYKQIMNL